MWPFKHKHKFKVIREGIRVCTKCGQEQVLVRFLYGPFRYQWADKLKFSTEDFDMSRRWIKGKKRY